MEATPQLPPAIVRPASNSQSEKQAENAILTAATLWKEARGEGVNGMHAVLNVIMNRAGSFDKIDTIILKRKQFSCWNSIDNPKQKSIEMGKLAAAGKLTDSKQFMEACELVQLAIDGKLTDITGGAKNYFNPKLANPSWAKKLTKTRTIGNHDFYTE